MLRPAPVKQRIRYVLVFLASVALLLVQGLPLHAHSAHHHAPQNKQLDAPHSHQHHADIHVGEFSEHDADHSSIATIDLSAVAVMKKISADSLFVAILAVCLLLLAPFQRRPILWSAFPETSFNTLNFVLRPPLRAPPR